MWLSRMTCGALLLLVAGCGRIGPGAAERPAATGVDDFSSSDPSTPRSEGYKSIYDEKGCHLEGGDSGAKLYQQCRSK